MAGTVRRKYESDRNNVYYITLDERPSVLAIAGNEPTRPITEAFTLKVSGNRRAFGLHPRYALFGRPLGTGDEPTDDLTYTKNGVAYKKVPLLTTVAAGTLDSTSALILGDADFTFIKFVNEILV